MPRHVYCTLLYSFFLMTLAAPSLVAAEGIMLSPLRVVMDEGQRYSTVTVLNQDTKKPVRFNIGTEVLRMNAKGEMVEPNNPEPQEILAGRMLRFSPTTSILPAGGKQVIRLMTKAPANLPEGEYLTYLSVMPEPLATEQEKEEKPVSSGVAMQLNILVGVRIPIIIRHGNLTMEAAPADMRLFRNSTGALVAETLIKRSGNRSCVLKVEVDHISGGNVTRIGDRPRIVIYLPLTERRVHIPLQPTNTLKSGDSLRIVLKDTEDNDRIVGERTYPLQ